MNFFIIFTTWYFFAFYIGLMVFIGIWYYIRIYLRKYRSAHNMSLIIQQEIEKLQSVENLAERFDLMNKWVQNQKSAYVKECFEPSWRAFYKKFIEYQRNGVTFTPDVFDYFHEEIFIHKYGKRKLAELIPGLFLAAGIFGTFLGIFSGVSQLDPSGDANAMRSGIGLLLSGMKVKFLASMAGIILSSFWQFFDKRNSLPSLQESFYRIRQGMDDTFPTQEESTVLYRMLQNQEKHMLDFQAFMSEKMIPQMMTGFTEAISSSLLPPLEQTQSLIGELVNKASVNQVEGMKQLTSEVMSSLNEITGEHMKNLGEALRTTIEWQQKVHDDMSGLVSSMQDSAREQSLMVVKTTNLTEQIHLYTEHVTEYQQVIERTVAQLNETTGKNSELHMAISDLLGRMVEEREVFHAHFEDHMGRFQINVETIVAQTTIQDSVQKQLERNLGQITNMADSQQQLVTSLSEQAVHSAKSGLELTDLLQRIEKNASMYIELQENVREILEKSGEERLRMDELADNIQTNLVDQVNQMDNRTKSLTTIWETNSSVMSKMSNQFATSMNQFTDDMHRGLNRTFEQFDEELTKSVGLLAKGVDAMRDGMVELPDVIQDLKKSVIEFNKLAKLATNP